MKENAKEMRGMFLQLGNNMWRDVGFSAADDADCA